MFIDVDKIPDSEDIIASVPELFNMPSWRSYKGRFHKNKVARYILILYNKEHQLNKSRIPYADRKKKALQLAGLANGKGEIDEYVMDFICNLKSPEIVNMILDYLRLQGNMYWAEILILEQELEECSRIRITPIEHFSKDIQTIAKGVKSKLREESLEIIRSLDELYKKFYGDFNDVHNAQRKKMTTMESRAKDLMDV